MGDCREDRVPPFSHTFTTYMGKQTSLPLYFLHFVMYMLWSVMKITNHFLLHEFSYLGHANYLRRIPQYIQLHILT